MFNIRQERQGWSWRVHMQQQGSHAVQLQDGTTAHATRSHYVRQHQRAHIHPYSWLHNQRKQVVMSRKVLVKSSYTTSSGKCRDETQACRATARPQVQKCAALSRLPGSAQHVWFLLPSNPARRSVSTLLLRNTDPHASNTFFSLARQ